MNDILELLRVLQHRLRQFTVTSRGKYLIIGTAVAIGLWIIIGGIMNRLNNGTVIIDTNGDSTIIVSRPGISDQEVGKGTSVTIHISPGTYTFTAKDGSKQAAKTVSVSKGETSQVELNLEQTVPLSQVLPFRASSLYINANRLYFLNLATQTPYSFDANDVAAKPYNIGIFQTARVQWLGPNNTYALANGVWYKINSDQTRTPLVSSEDSPSDADSFSANKSGDYSYIANDRQVKLVSGGSRKTIATAKTALNKTSLADDGSVLVYSAGPQSGAAQLYQNGRLTQLKVDLSNADFASWSPDNRHFGYTATDGIYIYDTANSKVTQVMSVSPSSSFILRWLNRDTMLYVQNNVLWRFDLSSQQSSKLTTIEGNMASFSPYVVGRDGQNVYFSTSVDANGKGNAIYRVVPNYNRLDSQQRQAVADEAIRPLTASLATMTYDGFGALTQVGVTDYQLSEAKYALSKFVGSRRLTVKKISIPTGGVSSSNSNDGVNSVSFSVLLDKKPYKAKLEYSGSFDAELRLFDKNDTQIFDSGSL